MNPRARQFLIPAALILIVILLAGATYQGVATALERRKYPHPGRLVDVGGHQLHIYCSGEGSPTVVLEAGASRLSAAWARVQPQVEMATRVCSYDRSGLGWSEAGDKPYDPGRVPDELYALLHAAKEQGPYIVAGNALGASFARLFASRYAAEVAGVVLVNPAPEEPAGDPRLVTLWPWLARAGLLRATGILSNGADGLPEPAAGAMAAFLNRPDHLTRAAREVARRDDAVRLGAAVEVPAGVSLFVTRVEEPNGHSALNDEHTATRVAAAILAAVRAARSR